MLHVCQKVSGLALYKLVNIIKYIYIFVISGQSRQRARPLLRLSYRIVTFFPGTNSDTLR
jgi:hypothetical protein